MLPFNVKLIKLCKKHVCNSLEPPSCPWHSARIAITAESWYHFGSVHRYPVTHRLVADEAELTEAALERLCQTKGAVPKNPVSSRRAVDPSHNPPLFVRV